ncbi:Hypothetical protein A7982_01224 [Minicystis rosea]|nr:Hypothetical protein A7982_01224 [Minicystis rosea]
MNSTLDPPVKVEVTETYVKTVFADVQVSTKVVKFSSVSVMKLLESNGLYKYRSGYVVELQDASGDTISAFIFKDLANAQRLMDVLAALRTRAAPKL